MKRPDTARARAFSIEEVSVKNINVPQFDINAINTQASFNPGKTQNIADNGLKTDGMAYYYNAYKAVWRHRYENDLAMGGQSNREVKPR